MSRDILTQPKHRGLPDNLRADNPSQLLRVQYRMDFCHPARAHVGSGPVLRTPHRHVRARTSPLSLQSPVRLLAVHDQSRPRVPPDISGPGIRLWDWRRWRFLLMHDLRRPVVCPATRASYRNRGRGQQLGRRHLSHLRGPREQGRRILRRRTLYGTVHGHPPGRIVPVGSVPFPTQEVESRRQVV